MEPIPRRIRVRLPRRLTLLLLAFGLVAGGIAVTAGPAHASVSQICSGFSGSDACGEVAGTTTHGWEGSSEGSYWGEDSGDNCTNYVAYYEQTVNGMSSSRPSWMPSGKGDADYWASEASGAGITVSPTPVVGAVAQWGDYTWNGDAGHVGIVEAVSNGGTSITVSWDSYSEGPYQWATITAGSPNTSTKLGWPNNFIYLGGVGSGGGSSSTSAYLAVAGQDGGVWASESPNPLQYVYGGTVSQVAISPNRIAVVDSSGNAYLEDLRSPTPSFNFLMANVAQIAITDDRIAVLDTSGNVWATDSGYTLQEIAGPATQIALSENRLIVVGTNGTAYARVGSTTVSGWQATWGPVSSVAVSDDMVALLTSTGDVYCSNGTDINSTQYYVTGGVAQVAVGQDASGNDRLGILGTDSTVYLTTGSCSSVSWTSPAGNVSTLSMSGPMIAVESPSGGVWAGTTGSSLANVASNAGAIATGS